MSTATHQPAAKVTPHAYGPPVVVEVLVKVQALAFQEADGGWLRRRSREELPGRVTEVRPSRRSS